MAPARTTLEIRLGNSTGHQETFAEDAVTITPTRELLGIRPQGDIATSRRAAGLKSRLLVEPQYEFLFRLFRS